VRQAGEVLVRMEAATLNQVDLYMRNSGAGITHQLPQIMGLDGAGTVAEVDADERVLQVGQKVLIHPAVTCGRCEFCQRGDNVLCTQIQLLGEHRHGTFAQWVSVPARNVFAMPPGLSFVQAAALGVNHITAWRMLVTKAQIKPWETVLIFGIGGGVSLAAMQLAKAMEYGDRDLARRPQIAARPGPGCRPRHPQPNPRRGQGGDGLAPTDAAWMW
jgi:NADPH:quinone reductase-like Zn-dependent oxidoreductase